ncbi:MAG: GNAT family N-acetyltransferase [Clostridia bacterium]|nr:GNAT family N-acetyltransferase [Clostridia bacterium]
MKIVFKEKLADGNLSERILQILTECSDEFVPPLTSRNSTTQSDFSDTSESGGEVPYAYYDMIKNQSALIAEDADGAVMGFMSYKTDYTNGIITEDYLPDIYISTVIAAKDFRRRGVTKSLYNALCEKYADQNIFTRTWSTNISHSCLLQSFGFSEFHRIKNDRGDGIDTVYYTKAKTRAVER